MITEEKLNAEFDIWFKRLQLLTSEELCPEDWTERWFDGYTPEMALEDGPCEQSSPEREYDPGVAPCDDAEFGMKP